MFARDRIDLRQDRSNFRVFHQRQDIFRHDICHKFHIACSKPMMERLGQHSLSFVPAAGAAVELSRKPGMGLFQNQPEQIGKQVMVAIPATFIIKGHQE